MRLADSVELTVCMSAIKRSSVHPEMIHLTRNKPMKENVFKAVIDEEVSRGAMDELRLKVASKLELVAMVAI